MTLYAHAHSHRKRSNDYSFQRQSAKKNLPKLTKIKRPKNVENSLKKEGNSSSKEAYENHLPIKRAVDSLRVRTFAQTDEEHLAFSDLYHKLMEAHYGEAPDKYFVLGDLWSYWLTQIEVEKLYQQPEKWAEYALQNIAGMGRFSTDRSIHDYAKYIWGITPCPIAKEELERVHYDYASHNRHSL